MMDLTKNGAMIKKINDNKALIIYEYGNKYLEEKEYEQAWDAFTEAKELSTNDHIDNDCQDGLAIIRCKEGVRLEELGKLELATVKFKEACSLAQSPAVVTDCKHNNGLCLIMMGNKKLKGKDDTMQELQVAYDLFTEAERLVQDKAHRDICHNNRSVASINMAHLLDDQGRHEQAIIKYEEAKALSSGICQNSKNTQKIIRRTNVMDNAHAHVERVGLFLAQMSIKN